MWARLENSMRTDSLINNFLRGRLGSNLHNGGRLQSDANFGFTAAVAECLLQSHADEISLLPGLPVSWKDGQLVQATIHADQDGTFRIAAQGKPGGIMSLKQGESKVWSGM